MKELDFWTPNFLTQEIVENIEENNTLPIYVYSEKKLQEAVDNFNNFPSAFGHTTRYAMKANSNINILKIFNNNGLKIDASSEFEAYRALNAWFTWSDIQVSGQELPNSLSDLMDKNVFIVATSLNQIEAIWKVQKWAEIWVRINPWTWSWAFKAISTWGETSAFGIWHEYIPQVKETAKKYDLKITKIHIHIWSENTPESWTSSANIWLDFVNQFEDATILDMGGGFKKAIMPYEQSADLQPIWESVAEKFREFKEKTWREIHLEVEPGKYMVINACSVVAQVTDVIDTGKEGYDFIRVNTGMTEMPRVPMYGVQEPIYIMNDESTKKDYVVVWHCCESGDILTSKLYNQEEIEVRSLNKAHTWDIMVIDGTWAYNSSMSMKNYNSFPEAGELMIRNTWEIVEIRKRQLLEDIWKNEISVV